MTGDRLWPSNRASRQGLGLMRLRDERWGDADRDPAHLFQAAVDSGVTIFDTAEMYGNEEVVGRALSGLHDQVTLCTKFGVYRGASGDFDDWNVRADADTVRTAIEGSLQRLGVEAIDLYYLHHRSDTTPIEETVSAMAELRQAGKIRALGLSNVTVDDIKRAHAVHPIEAVQEAWSWGRRDVEAILPVIQELGITLVAHSPMNHGDVQDSTPGALSVAAERYGLNSNQVALAWVHNQARRRDQLVIPIPGTTSIQHLLDNNAARDVLLDDDSMNVLSTSSTQQLHPAGRKRS
ncbi:aldo/keto reductase [Rhodococcus sp. H29-C3]|uniref:aldo/keto reductase n=1 Tax=Rhodococcus sp. H29-C3 TaxID=3046307 RepID=UPI0024B8EB1A|nr:aldo/keto reductase [Rhodococcus sp. H29-C3]MDJ0362515.1 aldo/keto reductase [Rhodococcus sp. H29-C3]